MKNVMTKIFDFCAYYRVDIHIEKESIGGSEVAVSFYHKITRKGWKVYIKKDITDDEFCEIIKTAYEKLDLNKWENIE